MLEKFFFVLGSIAGFSGVAAGAFGAHALKNRLSPDMLAVFETGSRYHLIHSLALLAAAWAVTRFDPQWSRFAGFFFAAGIVVFSGSLYTLALTGVRAWGAVTPLGGLMLLAGWACLAFAGARAS